MNLPSCPTVGDSEEPDVRFAEFIAPRSPRRFSERGGTASLPIHRGAGILLSIIFSSVNGANSASRVAEAPAAVIVQETTAAAPVETPAAAAPVETTAPVAAAPVTEAPVAAAPAVPIEFTSALTKAKTYSDMMSMSKAGLYDQLTSEYGEQFSPEAAQYAIDNVQADWNANALAKAKTYQESMAMSPAAIRDQLVSEYGEQFTAEEADFAILHLND